MADFQSLITRMGWFILVINSVRWVSLCCYPYILVAAELSLPPFFRTFAFSKLKIWRFNFLRFGLILKSTGWVGWMIHLSYLHSSHLLLLSEPLTFNSNWINFLLQWYQLLAKNPGLFMHQSQQTKHNESLGSYALGCLKGKQIFRNLTYEGYGISNALKEIHCNV
jgi:hypothetical protein